MASLILLRGELDTLKHQTAENSDTIPKSNKSAAYHETHDPKTSMISIYSIGFSARRPEKTIDNTNIHAIIKTIQACRDNPLVKEYSDD